jgi:hypothetical protein
LFASASFRSRSACWAFRTLAGRAARLGYSSSPASVTSFSFVEFAYFLSYLERPLRDEEVLKGRVEHPS